MLVEPPGFEFPLLIVGVAVTEFGVLVASALAVAEVDVLVGSGMEVDRVDVFVAGSEVEVGELPAPSLPHAVVNPSTKETEMATILVFYRVLQLPVLFLELLEASQLGNAHAFVLPLPAVEGVLRDAHLPAHFTDRCAALCLPQSEGDLLLRVPRSLHGMTTFLEAGIIPEN